MKKHQEEAKPVNKKPFVVFGTEAPLCGVPVIRHSRSDTIKMPPVKVGMPTQVVYVTKQNDEDDGFDFFD